MITVEKISGLVELREFFDEIIDELEKLSRKRAKAGSTGKGSNPHYDEYLVELYNTSDVISFQGYGARKRLIDVTPKQLRTHFVEYLTGLEGWVEDENLWFCKYHASVFKKFVDGFESFIRVKQIDTVLVYEI